MVLKTWMKMKEENGKTGTGIEISLTKKSILGAVHKLRHHNWQKMTEGWAGVWERMTDDNEREAAAG